MDWTILLLHAFWDSWLHERDVLLAQSEQHRTDGDATVYATCVMLAEHLAQRMTAPHAQTVDSLTSAGPEQPSTWSTSAAGRRPANSPTASLCAATAGQSRRAGAGFVPPLPRIMRRSHREIRAAGLAGFLPGDVRPARRALDRWKRVCPPDGLVDWFRRGGRGAARRSGPEQ